MGDKKYSILIVEDEEALSQALKKKFTSVGFDVLVAKDGYDGLLFALEHKPSIILLDLLMPKMDGMTMLKKLREDDWGENVSVIVLTNVNEESKMQEALQCHVHDFIVKSDWLIDDVVKKVEERLGL